MNKQEKLSADLSQEILDMLDSRTLAAGIPKREAAEMYREIASELRDRADTLDAEAEGDGD